MTSKSFTLPTPRYRMARRPLLSSCAIAAALIVTGQARGQSFNGSFGTPVNASVTEGAGTTNVTITAPRAIINWTPNDTAAGASPIAFQNSGTTTTFAGAAGVTDYVVLNRIVPTGAAAGRSILLDGNIASTLTPVSTTVQGGGVWFYTPNGLVIGGNANIDVGSLLLTTIDISDTDFNNFTTSAAFATATNPLAKITIQAGASITSDHADSEYSSYTAILAPQIEMAGTVRTDGSVAYVAGEGATLTFQASGLFDVTVTSGTDPAGTDPAINHTGSTTGQAYDGSNFARAIYMVAVPKNDAVTMLVSGDLGYDAAASASFENGAIVLAAGRDTVQSTDFGSSADFSLGNSVDPAFATNIVAGGGNWTSRTVASGTGDFSLAITGASLAVGDTGSSPATTALDLVVDDDIDIDLGGNSSFSASGNVFMNATGGGLSNGGSITIDALSSATMTIDGQTVLSASGNNDTTTNAFGGTVRITGTGANFGFGNGTGNALTLTALGEANGASFAEGAAGTGGTAQITLNGGALVADGGVSISANGEGDSSDAQAGNGTGGTASASFTNAIVSITGGISIAADGLGGNASNSGGAGGDGTGGTATLATSGSTSFGANNIFISAAGSGGRDADGEDGVSGGVGTGGVARADLAGSVNTVEITASANGTGGSGTATGFFGEGTNGGSGGNGAGGDAEVNILGSVTIADGSGILVTSRGIGGDGGASFESGYGSGNGGNGGAAASGQATLNISGTLTGSSPTSPVDINLLATAEGGDGGESTSFTSGVGGSATGGGIGVGADLRQNGGSVLYGNVVIDGRSYGGASGGNLTMDAAGDAEGGFASFYTSGVSTFSSLTLTSDALGGNGGIGGAATGGTARLEADGGTIAGSFGLTLAVNARGTGGSGFNGGGEATGGTAELIGSAATFSNISELRVIADASGGGSLNSGDGGDATGGNANLRITDMSVETGYGVLVSAAASAGGGGSDSDGASANGGTIEAVFDTATLNSGSLGLNVQASGSSGSSGTLNPGGGIGGSGTGGTIELSFINSVSAASVNLDFSGSGGFGGDSVSAAPTGRGGDGRGGTATVVISGADSDITGSISFDGEGSGGRGGRGGFAGGTNQAGGDGQGGTANVVIDDGAIFISNGSIDFDLTGAGGDGAEGAPGGISGAGGEGRGGDFTFDVVNGEAELNGFGGDFSATGGEGGNGFGTSSGTGGRGGDGGNGFGGSVTVRATGEDSILTLNDLFLTGNGTGGTGGFGGSGPQGGAGGSGGNGFGGTVRILSNDAAVLDIAGASGESLNLTLLGFGGDGQDGAFSSGVNVAGGAGGNGGFGQGGTAEITATGGSISIVDTQIAANGRGGFGGLGGTGTPTPAVPDDPLTPLIDESQPQGPTPVGADGFGGSSQGGSVSILLTDSDIASGQLDLGSVDIEASGLSGFNDSQFIGGGAGSIDIENRASVNDLLASEMNLRADGAFFFDAGPRVSLIADNATINVSNFIDVSTGESIAITARGNGSITSSSVGLFATGDILVSHEDRGDADTISSFSFFASSGGDFDGTAGGFESRIETFSNLSISASGSIRVFQLDSGVEQENDFGSVFLSAGGGITVTDSVLAASDIFYSARDDIDVGDTDAGRNATILIDRNDEGTGGVTGRSIRSRANNASGGEGQPGIYVESYDTIDVERVNSESFVTLYSETGDVNVTTDISAGGDLLAYGANVLLRAEGDLNVDLLEAFDGDVDIVTAGDLDLDYVIARGNNLTAYAGGALNVGFVQAEGSGSVVNLASGYDPVTGQFTSASNLNIEGSVSAVEAVNIDGGGDVLIDVEAIVRANGDIIINSGDDVIIDGVIGQETAGPATTILEFVDIGGDGGFDSGGIDQSSFAISGAQAPQQVGGPSDLVRINAGILRVGTASGDPATIENNGSIDALAIDLLSEDIIIGASGSIGSTNTATLDLTNTGTGVMTLGGNGVTTGYSLANAEFGRLFANAITTVTGLAGNAPDPALIVQNLTINAGSEGNLIGSDGSFTMISGGNVRVEGAVRMVDAGANNLLALRGGDRVEIIAPSGSLGIRGPQGQLAGRLIVSGGSIYAASSQAIAVLGELPSLAARSDRLDTNDGQPNDDGHLFANAITFEISGGVYIQNSGGGDPADLSTRRGFTVGSGGLSIFNTNDGRIEIAINGRQSAEGGGFITGEALIPFINITGEFSSGLADTIDNQSTVNGCLILGVDCETSIVVTGPPTQDLVNEIVTPPDDVSGEGGLLVLDLPLIELAGFAPINRPPMIEEPVTGAGNEDLWTEFETAGEDPAGSVDTPVTGSRTDDAEDPDGDIDEQVTGTRRDEEQE